MLYSNRLCHVIAPNTRRFVPWRLLICCIAFAVACDNSSSGDTQTSTPVIQAVGNRFIDKQGREIMLRGLNVRIEGVFDGHPDIGPFPPFGEDDCRRMGEEFGFNFLRLCINWSLLEPVQGEFDEAYLERVLDISETCSEYGVWTLVDLHQDSYSRFVGHDGAPLWAHEPPVDPEVAAADRPQAIPLDTESYIRFESFFDNVNGVQDAYLSMVDRLARRIDGQPGVIGLEIMNEPILIQREERLTQFFRKASKTITRVAPDLLVFYEPNSTRNMSDFITVTEAFGEPNAVYSPHLYTGVHLAGWEVGDNEMINDSVERMVEEAKALGSPLLVGEFGHNPAETVGAAWIEAAIEAFDLYRTSWAFWVYEEWAGTCDGFVEFLGSCWGLYDSTVEEDPQSGETLYGRGALRNAAVDSIARPFPEAISGSLEFMEYSPESRELHLRIAGDPGDHLIAFPQRTYPQGINAYCDDQPIDATSAGGRVRLTCPGSRLMITPR